MSGNGSRPTDGAVLRVTADTLQGMVDDDSRRAESAPVRTPSALDAIADSYVTAMAEADPFFATSIGVPGHDHEVSDLSPAGFEAAARLRSETLARIAGVEDQDDVDAVTRAAMLERLGLEDELDRGGAGRAQVNNIASPLQSQAILDLMPTHTPEQWEAIAERMSRFPAALSGWAETLRAEAASGYVSARRQLQLGAEQARGYADPDGGYFAQLVGRLDASSPQRATVEAGAKAASQAYLDLADVLDELVPQAPDADGVGSELYQLCSRSFLGDTIDLRETYDWGVEQVRSLIAEQEQVARRINERYGNGGGDSIEAAKASLDADPERTLDGTDALKSWMQETADAAIRDLAGVHFDIPEKLRTIECCIAETGSGGIYYTPPSEDFSRPGRMWWDVPHGTTEFHTWQEKTTVYHEGVPGHHLQCGIQVLHAPILNRWRALACWVSGQGEGWALYSERLMEQLGYLDDDGDRLGMLDAQRLRAGRVVLDIGLHNGFAMPEGIVGSAGGDWTYDKAWEFMTANWGMAEAERRFELHRYLGWPGQAPSYKVGQRVWEDLRAAHAGEGASSEQVRAFHTRALALGSLPLSVLREALAR